MEDDGQPVAEENSHNPWLWPFVIFLACNVLFSLTGDWIAGVMGAVGIVATADADAEEDTSWAKTSGKAKKKAKPKKAKAKPPPPKKKKIERNTQYPKTTQPQVLFQADGTTAGAPAFPNLRIDSGALFDKGNTDVKMATDGKRLIIEAFAHDQKVAELIDSNGSEPWMDDGLEFYFSEKHDSQYYHFMVISCSGKYVFCKAETLKGGWRQDEISSHGIKVQTARNAGGFSVKLEVPLADIGLPELATNDKFFGQIARNYRGQGNDNSILLHLFPVRVYVDNTLHSNHARGAFQPFKVVGKADQPKAP